MVYSLLFIVDYLASQTAQANNPPIEHIIYKL